MNTLAAELRGKIEAEVTGLDPSPARIAERRARALEPTRELIERFRPDLLPLAEGLEGHESLISNSRLCLTIGWEPRTSWRDLRDQMEQDAEDAEGDGEAEYEGDDRDEPAAAEQPGEEDQDEDSAKY